MKSLNLTEEERKYIPLLYNPIIGINNRNIIRFSSLHKLIFNLCWAIGNYHFDVFLRDFFMYG